MRSLVLLLISLGVLLMAFMVYELVQPPVEPLNKYPHSDVLTAPPPATDNRMGIGPGQGVWIERHDPNTARLTERFRGEHYDWNPDGTMKVDKPQAEFFLDQGRVLRVDGDRGNVVVEQGAPGTGKSVMANQPDAPTRGNMKDVTIRLLASESSVTPILTVTMDNATFDTQINRIYTNAATIDGKEIAPDQIPVHMRGADYDFDGRGMQIRWDQQHKKLQLLQIDHGEQLTIKHPGGERENEGRPANTSTAPAAISVAAVQGASRKPAASRATSEPSVQIYRASFQQNVKVVQAKAELATADEMQVDFASEQSPSSAQPTTQSKAPQTKSSHSASAGPGEPPARNTPENTGLSDAPIRITWSGKLTVTPIDQSGELRADVHGQVVHLMGTPAVVQQKGTRVQGRMLAYSTSQGELIAEGADQNPVVMTNSDGGRVQTQSLKYFRQPARAILGGAGEVSRPVKSDTGAVSIMQAQWTHSCDLTFFGDDAQNLAIHTADLVGSVRINHPQIKLDAEQLAMNFIENAGDRAQPDLESLHAAGSVHATLNDSHGKPQSIQCQTLDLSTDESRASRVRYIKQMVADGQVRAYGPDQEIRAGHLDAVMVPTASTTQPSANQPLAAVQLEHLLAQKDVHVRGRDGGSADAQSLQVTMDGAEASRVILKGQPARVIKGQDITVGDEIDLRPKAQTYAVVGPGSMHLSRQTENDSPPTDVWWQGGLRADLEKNAIDINRGVKIETVASDQTTNSATSAALHITLTSRPQVSTDKAHADKSSVRSQNDSLFSSAADVDLSQQKEATALTLTGDVRLQSLRGDNKGHLLMQFNLESSRLDYAIPQQKMIVPQPGKIFFYDNRPATEPSSKPATGNPLAGGDRRGMTAIKWDGELVYDQNSARIALDKNVFLRHEPLDKAQSPIDLRAGHMTVDLLKTGEQSAGPEQMSIRHLVAVDHVMFTTKTAQCQAASVDYTPATGLFIVRGAPDAPAVLFDQQGASKGTFAELHYNMKTEQIESMTGFHANVRRGK